MYRLHFFILCALFPHLSFPTTCLEGTVELNDYCVKTQNIHYVQPGKPDLLQTTIQQAKSGDYIILQTGDYELNSVNEHTAVLIEGKKSLHLIGQENTWLRTKEGWVAVLTIHDSENITIRNLGLVHDVRKGYCEGVVIRLLDVKDVKIIDSILNGSGTKALQMDNAQQVSIVGGEAINNTEGVFEIRNSQDITVKEMLIADNDNSGYYKRGILDVQNSSKILMNYNLVKNNQNAYFKKIYRSQDLVIDGNDFMDNTFVVYDASELNSSSPTFLGNVLATETVFVHSDNPPFEMEIYGYLLGQFARIKGIKIYQTQPAEEGVAGKNFTREANPIQLLTELNTQTLVQEAKRYIKFIDVNFDGYLDIHLMEKADGDNSTYLFFLFDPQRRQFVKNAILSGLASPSIDSEQQFVISSWKNSDTHYGKDFYQFEQGKPQLIRQEIKNYSNLNSYELTVKQKVGDEMQVITQTTVQENQKATKDPSKTSPSTEPVAEPITQSATIKDEVVTPQPVEIVKSIENAAILLHSPFEQVSNLSKAQLQNLEQLANHQDILAQLLLGFYWYQTDNRAAFTWFEKAALLGNSRAQNQLGWLYFQGQGVRQDDTQAAIWFRKAAGQGHASAQNSLAGLYYEGRGLPQNFAQAAYWVLKSAQQGNVKAQYNLARLYQEGNGVPLDLYQALCWLKRAIQTEQSP